MTDDESWEKMLLPGVPFSTIRNKKKLFYSYDPSGANDFDARYCPHCRCPKNYCSNIVLGDLVNNSVEFYIYKEGLLDTCLDRRSLVLKYTQTYSEQVAQKMLENGIGYDKGFSLYKFYELPDCMQDRLYELVDRIGRAQKKGRKALWDKKEAEEQKRKKAKVIKNEP